MKRLVAPLSIMLPVLVWSALFAAYSLLAVWKEHSEYARIADMMEVHFFDAGSVVASSEIDGFHIDPANHAVLGEAMAAEVVNIGWPPEPSD